MKQPLKVSIDEEILETAKNDIPNISNFIEGCLKAYIMLSGMNEEQRGEELRKAWETFRESQLRIHLLTNIDFEKQSINKLHEKLKTDAWLNGWADYRRTGSTQDYKIEESANALGLETDVLQQLLYDTYVEAKKDMTKLYIFDNWSYIKENILPYVEVEEEEEFDLDDLLNGKVDLD